MIELVKEFVEKDLALQDAKENLHKHWTDNIKHYHKIGGIPDAYVKVNDKTYYVDVAEMEYREVMIAPEVFE